MSNTIRDVLPRRPPRGLKRETFERWRVVGKGGGSSSSGGSGGIVTGTGETDGTGGRRDLIEFHTYAYTHAFGPEGHATMTRMTYA